MDISDLYKINDGDSGEIVANGLYENSSKIVNALNEDLKAEQVKFTDGETFQQKLDNGKLKGEKGDTGAKGDPGTNGATGPKGDKGDPGENGTSITSITLYKNAKGLITSGKAVLSDKTEVTITITEEQA